MEDTEWICSIFTDCFCPLFQAVSSLQVTRRIFRKTWSSSTVKLQSWRFSLYRPHECILLYAKRKSLTNYIKLPLPSCQPKKRKITLPQSDVKALKVELNLPYLHNESKQNALKSLPMFENILPIYFSHL